MSEYLIKCLWKGVADVDQQQDAAERIEQLAANNEEMEAKLSNAVEALVRIADIPSEMTWGVDSEVREAMNGMEIIAETTLAELKGQDDE